MNNGHEFNCATSTGEEVVIIDGEDASTEFDRTLFCHYCTKGNILLPYTLYKFRINRKVRRSLIAIKREIKAESTAPSSSVSYSINDVISNRNSACEFISLESDWSDSYSFSPEYLNGRIFKMSDSPVKPNQCPLNISITFEQMLNIRKKRLRKKRQNSNKLDQSNSVKVGNNGTKSDTLVFSSTEEGRVAVMEDTVSTSQSNNDFTNNNVIQNCTLTSTTLNCKQSLEENNSLCNISDITSSTDTLQLSEEIIEIIDKNNLENSRCTSVTTVNTDNRHLAQGVIEILDDTILLPNCENVSSASLSNYTFENDINELTRGFHSFDDGTSNNGVSSNGILNSIENTNVKEDSPNVVKENINIKPLENNPSSVEITFDATVRESRSSSRKPRKRKRSSTNDSVICLSDSMNKSSDDIIFVSDEHSTTSPNSSKPKKRKTSVVVIDEDNSVFSSGAVQSRRNNKQRTAEDSSSRFMSLNTHTFRQRRNLRTIIIDGSNVAYGHANGKYFSVKGLAIAIEHFLIKGHKVVAFVPQFRTKSGESSDPKLLRSLADKGLVALTPSRDVKGVRITSYDDRFIIKYATGCEGIVVSNDNYRDLLNERVDWRHTIENRLLMYTWVGDIIMLPDDPLGKHGPRLSEFLSF